MKVPAEIPNSSAKTPVPHDSNTESDCPVEPDWKGKAPTTRKLIVDFLDNRGGDTSVAWYQLFYDDNAKEIWFGNLRKSGMYQMVKLGSFLPTVPQFCALDDQSCDKGLYEPRKQGFKGEVRLMVNEWCISSCTGFVWSVKDQLG